jgi:hypothetical protein
MDIKQTVMSSSLLAIFIGSIPQEMCSTLRQQPVLLKSVITMIFVRNFCGFHVINCHMLNITCLPSATNLLIFLIIRIVIHQITIILIVWTAAIFSKCLNVLLPAKCTYLYRIHVNTHESSVLSVKQHSTWKYVTVILVWYTVFTRLICAP